jgi:AraC-like DNA-binding protein
MKLIQISTDELPEPFRLELLRETYGRTIIKHEFEPMGDRPLRFEADLLQATGLGLGWSRSSPARFRRGPEHVDSDDFVLNITLTGGRAVQQLGREVVLRQGEAVLTSCADPGVVTLSSESGFRSIRVTRDLLKANVADFDACLVRPISRDNPALQLLIAYLAGLREVVALTAGESHEHLFAHVQDLLWTALGPSYDAGELAKTRGIRGARLLAIKRDIMERLDDDSLSVGTIAARQGITPRYVHSLFHADGITFSAFVLEHRLARAHRMLCDPVDLRSRISTIAFRCGFADLSWFNRVFRKRYGATPSNIREIALSRRT